MFATVIGVVRVAFGLELTKAKDKDKAEKWSAWSAEDYESMMASRPGSYTAWGSLNLPTCWMWYMRSPPVTYSITKYRRSYKGR